MNNMCQFRGICGYSFVCKDDGSCLVGTRNWESNKMKKFYLAHPFDTRKWVREWELRLEKELGVVFVNPFYDLVRSDIEQIDAGRNERYEKLDPAELVKRDVQAIYSVDGLVGIVDGSLSYGTIMEIVYAWVHHIPVYLIITNGHHGHPWLVYHSTKIFTSLEEFERLLNPTKEGGLSGGTDE